MGGYATSVPVRVWPGCKQLDLQVGPEEQLEGSAMWKRRLPECQIGGLVGGLRPWGPSSRRTKGKSKRCNPEVGQAQKSGVREPVPGSREDLKSGSGKAKAELGIGRTGRSDEHKKACQNRLRLRCP